MAMATIRLVSTGMLYATRWLNLAALGFVLIVSIFPLQCFMDIISPEDW